MKKAAAYLRVSLKSQAEDGVSLDTQLDRIEAYCKYKSLDLINVIRDEGVSGGKNKSREGFQTLLDHIEAGDIDVVVLFSLERLSRDMLTLLALERLLNEYNVELHTVDGLVDTSTPDGFMNFGMKAFLGEFERRQVQYRTRVNMQYLKAKGRVVGAIPYGFKGINENVEGKGIRRLEADPEEQKVVQIANGMYEHGAILNDIRHSLTSMGYRSRSGKPFTPQQVKRMLPDYKNRWESKRTETGETIRKFLCSIA